MPLALAFILTGPEGPVLLACDVKTFTSEFHLTGPEGPVLRVGPVAD